MGRVFLVMLAGWTLTAQAFSPEKVAALSAGMERELRRTLTMVDDPALLAYMAGIGRRLGGDWKLALYREDLARPADEPLALPGGSIYLPVPMFLAAKNEAELARQLAHAMAHITGQHALRAAERGRDEKLTSIPLVFFGGPGLMPQGFRKIWQEFEVEAARWTADRLEAAGYDLGAAPTVEFMAMQERLRERPVVPRRAPSLRRQGEL